jgi:hypothetical protein
MSDSMPVYIRYEGNELRKTIQFPEDFTEELLIEEVGPELFLLKESSLAGFARYHDVVHATRSEDGSLLFRRIVEQSSFVTSTYILPEGTADSAELEVILSEVMDLGGCWERAFGGVLLIHLPPGKIEGFEERIKELGLPVREQT